MLPAFPPFLFLWCEGESWEKNRPFEDGLIIALLHGRHLDLDDGLLLGWNVLLLHAAIPVRMYTETTCESERNREKQRERKREMKRGTGTERSSRGREKHRGSQREQSDD